MKQKKETPPPSRYKREGGGPAFMYRRPRCSSSLVFVVPCVCRPWRLSSPVFVVPGVCRPLCLSSPVFVVPGVRRPLCSSSPCHLLSFPAFVSAIHPPRHLLGRLFVGVAVPSSLSRLYLHCVVPAVCGPPFVATIIISTSNSSYEQWLVGRMVVLVTWQWWRPTLLVGGLGLLAVAV
jgi:hypothetical protein